MLRDRFVRFCLGSIVLLLGVIACRTNAESPRAIAAEPSEHLVENGQLKVDQNVTAHLNERAKQGWKLHTLTAVGGMIWYK